MQKVSFFRYWDELYAALCIPLVIINFKGKIKLKKENKYIHRLVISLISLILIGLLSNAAFKYQKPEAALQDIFTNLKFYMGILTTCYIFKNFKIEKYKKKINFHAKVLLTIFFVLVVQNKVTHIFPTANIRFGINSEQIFFSHPTELASVTFFLLLIYMLSITKNRGNLLFISMAILVILSTLRFKAIAAVIIFVYINLIVMSGRKITFGKLLLTIPFFIMFALDDINFYFFSSESMNMARGALTFTAFKVAKDAFPLGAGFGTFASWASGVYYSPVYQLYGISRVWGLNKEYPMLVSDVFWPMIIAQNGFIGLILYIIIIYSIWMIVLKCSKIDRWMYISGSGAILYLLISSTSESSFVNPLSLPLALVIGICIIRCRQEEKDEM